MLWHCVRRHSEPFTLILSPSEIHFVLFWSYFMRSSLFPYIISYYPISMVIWSLFAWTLLCIHWMQLLFKYLFISFFNLSHCFEIHSTRLFFFWYTYLAWISGEKQLKSIATQSSVCSKLFGCFDLSIYIELNDQQQNSKCINSVWKMDKIEKWWFDAVLAKC